jgi:predicted nucleic acid-binding protein
MNPAERVFLDAGLFIGALLAGDPRHAEARGIVEAVRRGELAACTSVGVLAGDLWHPRSRDCAGIRRDLPVARMERSGIRVRPRRMPLDQ